MGTPIGNLLDFTMRAKLTLNYVDLILAEDTRKSRILLDFYQIRTDIRSFHNWNEKKNAGIIAENIKTKKLAYALISDAGMPQISDPGFVLVIPGRGEIIMEPVSVCHHVSTIAHCSLPIFS